MRGLYIKSIPFGKNVGGGGITHTLGMIRGFFETGADMTIVTNEAFDIDDTRVINLKIPYNRKGLPFFRDYLFFRKYRKALLQWLEQNDDNYDFVYCRHRDFCNLPLVAQKKLGALLVLEVNGILHETVWPLTLYPNMLKRSILYKPLFYLGGFVIKKSMRAMELPVLRVADKVVVVSEQMKKNLLDGRYKRAEDILVLPNGVDTNRFAPDEIRRKQTRQLFGIQDDQILIGFAGTFGSWHGIPELTKCFKRLTHNEKANFLLIGDGLLKKDMERELMSFPQAHFTGQLPYSKMPIYLDACDILVISNSWDSKNNKPFFGSPTKLFEYMSMGKAIAASRLEQIDEILSDGDSALMFEPGNVDEMEAVIVKLINDAMLRRRLGENARKIAIEKHTWRKNAETVLSIVREIQLNRGDKISDETSI